MDRSIDIRGDLLQELAHKMWRLRSPVIWECELGTRAADAVSLSLSLRTQNREPGVQGQEKMHVRLSSQRQQTADFFFLHLFVLFGPSGDWMLPPAWVKVVFFTESVNSNAHLN